MSLPRPKPGSFVLVTGAASGIGTELARQLGEMGYDLVLADRDEDGLGAVAAEVRQAASVEVESHVCDLTSERGRTALIKAIREHPGQLVGLCNNAGIASLGRFHEIPLKREREMVGVNAVAVHHIMGELLPILVENGEGAVLNTASLAANQPLPRLATYAATKAFVHTLSEAVHAELAGTGVSCTSLCPGATATNLVNIPGLDEDAHRIIPDQVWASPAGVARAGIDGMKRGRRAVVPGVANRAIIGPVGRHVPRSLGLPAVERLIGLAEGRVTRTGAGS
jgi:short-subunit dehydrogenase